jgi:16S rRNA (adenine1518-N6/adenine1519-N6)-dimethyltransferase
VVEDIADSCSDTPDATILEIGPGIGVLTQELAFRYKKVLAVEIDNGLIPVLRYTLSECPEGVVEVIHGDIMKTDLKALLAPAFEAGKVSVCANLPYYITTPILMALLESGLPFESITIMIQSEVADRLCAKAGSKEYGAITAVVDYYGRAEKLFKVSAGNFIPAPKVDSTVVRINLHKQKPYVPKDEATLFRTIRAAFEQRRKTLPNALSAGFQDVPKDTLTAIIESCGHRPDIRGERLDIADFVALADRIYDERSGK